MNYGKNKDLISTIKTTGSQNPDCPETNLQIETCSPDIPYPTQNYVSQKYEETAMTVREAKCTSDSDSD